MSITTITSKGQVTIPVEVRRALKLKERDRLEIKVEGDRAVVRKLKPAAELRGSVPVEKKQEGVTWREIERRAAEYRARQGA
jgi:antitoxin PrlF